MAPAKGSRNAGKYHEAKTTECIARIESHLKGLRNGVSFKNLFAISVHVAPSTGLSAGNLRKNLQYRQILEGYLAKQPGAATLLNGRIDDPRVLKQQLTNAQAKTCRLEAENKRLRADKRRLSLLIEQQVPALGPKWSATESEEAPSGKMKREIKSLRQSFECTAHLLKAVLDSVRFIRPDFATGTLINTGGRPGEPPIANRAVTAPYFSWLKGQNAEAPQQ